MAPLLGDAFYPCKSHHLVGDRGRANHCLTSPQQWGVGKWCFLLKLCNTYLRRVSWETVEMMYVLCYAVLCELSNKQQILVETYCFGPHYFCVSVLTFEQVHESRRVWCYSVASLLGSNENIHCLVSPALVLPSSHNLTVNDQVLSRREVCQL